MKIKWILPFAGILIFASVQAAELQMDKSACQLVSKHHPDADVAYQPGIDAEGRRVVPADLNGPGVTIREDEVRIKLTDDAAKVFGLHVPEVRQGWKKERMVDPELEIGYVTLKDGKAYLNDKPLDQDGQDELAVLCIGVK
jgi:hypothetical protein